MHLDQSQEEAAAAVDEATKKAIEDARVEARLVGTITPEQSRINARKRHEAWQKSQEPVTNRA